MRPGAGSGRRGVLTTRVPLVVLVVGIVVTAIGLVLVRTQYSAFRYPSLSMSPTLTQGETVFAHHATDPHRGDLVVFDGQAWRPRPASALFVKRVVGVVATTSA